MMGSLPILTAIPCSHLREPVCRYMSIFTRPDLTGFSESAPSGSQSNRTGTQMSRKKFQAPRKNFGSEFAIDNSHLCAYFFTIAKVQALVPRRGRIGNHARFMGEPIAVSRYPYLGYFSRNRRSLGFFPGRPRGRDRRARRPARA